MDIGFGALDGEKCRIGVITTRWNKDIIDSLKGGITEALTECKVEDANVFETEVPGAFELPLAARFLAMSGTVDAVICVGCLIKGDTQHFEYIADSVSSGIMSVGLQTSTPIVFGVLTVNDEQQARDRAFGPNNHGISWGKTAVEMALLRQSALGQGKKGTLGFGEKVELDADGKTKASSFGF
jgi:6,7-dimethyl-8-ribityllumazine synthase